MGLFVGVLLFFVPITVSEIFVSEKSFADKVASYCLAYALTIAWILYNFFICYMLVQMCKPLTNQQNASLIKHLRNRHNVLMDKMEAKQVYEEVKRSLAHLEEEEEEYEPAMDLAERVFAKFMNNSMIENFKESLSDFDDSQSLIDSPNLILSSSSLNESDAMVSKHKSSTLD